jgi:hypothetical protein
MVHSFAQDLEQLDQFTASCVEYWKRDEDCNGYEHLMHSLALLENLLETYYDTFGEYKGQLYSILEKLLHDVRNKDIIAVIDLLEYELLPMFKSWGKAVSINDRPSDSFAG